MRKSTKSKRDEVAFRDAQQDIAELRWFSERGGREFVFFDETGVSLEPSIPYGWTPRGEVWEIPSQKSQRLKVLGFWNEKNELFWETTVESVTSSVVIEFFDRYCAQLSFETTVILDNAPIHTSGLFLDQTPRWEEAGLFLYYLPTYSPELNWIEMLWRKLKYEWLPLDAYLDLPSLFHEVEIALMNVGQEHFLNLTPKTTII